MIRVLFTRLGLADASVSDYQLYYFLIIFIGELAALGIIGRTMWRYYH